MEQDQFIAIMPYISEDLAGMIARKQGMSETEAVTALFESKLYSLLEDESSKLWQYSTEMLYSLFAQERETGRIVFPDV